MNPPISLDEKIALGLANRSSAKVSWGEGVWGINAKGQEVLVPMYCTMPVQACLSFQRKTLGPDLSDEELLTEFLVVRFGDIIDLP